MKPQKTHFLSDRQYKPDIRCVNFPSAASFGLLPGWQQRCMSDAQTIALAWINANPGISIHTIETNLANNYAIITVWYKSPFSTDRMPPDSGVKKTPDWE